MASDTSKAEQRLHGELERLSALRAELREGLSRESETASLEELSDSDQHPAEMATETFNRERDLGTLESVEAELQDVEQALDRLGQGRYGLCTVCGRAISEERLEALPATPYCIGDARRASAEAAPGMAPVGSDGGGLDEPGRAI